MAVKKYSLKEKGGNFKLSEHFSLKEFACKDGSDAVLVSEELIEKLEQLRAYGDGFTIHINSGYRTPAHNKKVGGASKSSHTEGLAADIVLKKDGKPVDPKLVACLCQTIGFSGIGRMRTAVHVDMKGRTYRGDELKGYSNNTGGDFYSYFGITKDMVADLK